jgi:hypothetical protein
LRSAKSVEQQEGSLDIYEIDSIILKGCTKSVASVIKANAIKTAMIVKSFDNLTDQQKVGISLGFSLIVDHSKNDSLCGSQKPLFPEEAWRELKNRVYEDRNNLPMVPISIEKKLKEIEPVKIIT